MSPGFSALSHSKTGSAASPFTYAWNVSGVYAYLEGGKYAYIDFAQDGECDAVVELAELLDLVIAARVLAAELVAGEAEDHKVGVLSLEILLCCRVSHLLAFLAVFCLE
jgi:hypothetical protein